MPSSARSPSRISWLDPRFVLDLVVLAVVPRRPSLAAQPISAGGARHLAPGASAEEAVSGAFRVARKTSLPASAVLIASAAAPRGYARIRRHDLFKCDVAADDFG